MSRRPALLAAALLLTPVLFAQERQEVEAKDYTRPTLRFIFRDYLATDPETGFEPKDILSFRMLGTKFTWAPFTTGEVNDGSFGSASLMQPIDPFYMTQTSFPATKDTYTPAPTTQTTSLGERWYRRQMLRVTRDANRKENDGTK
jgi:hypothetical protein